MRIYSNVLTKSDLYETAYRILGLDAEPIERPRVRSHGWLVSTRGNSARFKNSGKYGASDERAATYDDHGRWFARLYNVDPHAEIVAAGRYRSREDFHAQTDGKYRHED